MTTEAQRRPRSKAKRILILVVMVAGTAALISGCAGVWFQIAAACSAQVDLGVALSKEGEPINS